MGVAMRRLLLAAAMFGVVSGATAADMPDFLRGSLSAGPVPTVNWQGFYIGAQAGYGSSDENFSGSNSTMLAALLSNNVVEEMGVSRWNLGLGKNSGRAPGPQVPVGTSPWTGTGLRSGPGAVDLGPRRPPDHGCAIRMTAILCCSGARPGRRGSCASGSAHGRNRAGSRRRPFRLSRI